jgi:hypothetical protein
MARIFFPTKETIMFVSSFLLYPYYARFEFTLRLTQRLSKSCGYGLGQTMNNEQNV